VLFPLTMAVIATNRPPGPLGSATPAAYGLAYRDVAFRTAPRAWKAHVLGFLHAALHPVATFTALPPSVPLARDSVHKLAGWTGASYGTATVRTPSLDGAACGFAPRASWVRLPGVPHKVRTSAHSTARSDSSEPSVAATMAWAVISSR